MSAPAAPRGDRSPSRGRALRRRGLAAAADALAFTLLATAMTWPLGIHLATHAPGSDSWSGRAVYFETPVNVWNLWWFRHALFDLGRNPFDCPYLFHPHGANLWFHTLAPLPAAAGALLQSILGLVAAHNVLVLASFAASGLAAAALARYLALDRPAAFIAGAVYAFSPAVLAHLYVGHFELLWTAWMPAVLLAFLHVIDRERGHWPAAVSLALLLAGAAYTSPYYALYSAELLALATLVRWRRVWRSPVLKQLAAAAVIAALAAAPLLAHYAQGGRAAPDAKDFRVYALEPIAFALPSFMHPVLAAPLAPAHRTIHRGLGFPQETTGYLGVAAIGLAALAFRRRRLHPSSRRLLAAVAGCFLILALGAELKMLGTPTGVPLPAALLAELPVVSLARAPGRHVIVAMLAVAVLAAAGWRSIASRRWRAVLVVLLAFDYWARVPLMRTDVPEVYHRLADEPDTFAILEVPAGARDGTRALGRPDAFRLLAQTVHRKPIVEGMVSRLPDGTWAAIASAPLIGALLQPDIDAAPSPEAAAYFARWNIRAIVVHPGASDRDRRLIEGSLAIGRRETFADGVELWLVR